MKITKLIAGLVVLSAMAVGYAQDQGERRQGPPALRPSPIIEALDANKDGEIDANEINNAAAALKKLDKNGDGKLTMEEVRPRGGRPGGPGGGDGDRPDRPNRGERPDGPRGPRGPEGKPQPPRN